MHPFVTRLHLGWYHYFTWKDSNWLGIQFSSWRIRIYARWFSLMSTRIPYGSTEYFFKLLWRPSPKFIEVKLGKFYRCFKYGG